MRAALHAARTPATPENGFQAQAEAAAVEIRRAIARLRQDPASREAVVQLIMANERLGEVGHALREAAEADRAARAALAEFTASVGIRRRRPRLLEDASRPPVFPVGAWLPIPLAGLYVALRTAAGRAGAAARHHIAATALGSVTAIGAGTAVAVTGTWTLLPSTTEAAPVVTPPVVVPAPAAQITQVPAPGPGRGRHHRSHTKQATSPQVSFQSPAPKSPAPSSSPSPATTSHLGVIQALSPLVQAAPGSNVMIVVIDYGGPACWSANASGAVVLHKTGGCLEDGQSAAIPLTADGNGTVIVTGPAGQTVTVRVAIRLRDLSGRAEDVGAVAGFS